MSDTDTDHPMLDELRKRRAMLLRTVDDTNVRIDEIDRMITTLEDGHSRVRRKLKGNAGQPDLGDALRASLDLVPPQGDAA